MVRNDFLAAVGAAAVAGEDGESFGAAFGFAGCARSAAAAIEWFGFLEWDFGCRRNGQELTFVGWLLVEMKGLVTYRSSLATIDAVSIVVDDSLPRTAINDGLIPF